MKEGLGARLAKSLVVIERDDALVDLAIEFDAISLRCRQHVFPIWNEALKPVRDCDTTLALKLNDNVLCFGLAQLQSGADRADAYADIASWKRRCTSRLQERERSKPFLGGQLVVAACAERELHLEQRIALIGSAPHPLTNQGEPLTSECRTAGFACDTHVRYGNGPWTHAHLDRRPTGLQRSHIVG